MKREKRKRKGKEGESFFRIKGGDSLGSSTYWRIGEVLRGRRRGTEERGTGRRIGGLGEILRIFEEKAQRSRKGASATEFVQPGMPYTD